MAEKDDEEKTEEPSSKKREDAFKEGTFPNAPEVQMAFMMLAAFIALLFYATSAAQQVGHMTMGLFYGIKDVRIDEENAAWWMVFLFKQGIIIVSPVVIPCTLASIAGGGLQTGFKITTKVFAWKPERLNPVEGLKNLFSKNKLQTFFIELLKFITVLVIVYNGVRILLDDPIFHHPVSAHYTLQFLHRLFLVVFVRLVIAVGIIAAINYFFEIKKTTEKLRMSKSETKRERKNQEVSQNVRGKQRAFARQLAQRQMLASVPNADVVVTNPTHFAIALKYERGKDDAPMILAKGQNLIAQQIKDIAKEHGVPMVENKPVAQMLFKMGKVGYTIPYELYQLVAEILAYVYKTHRYYVHQLQNKRNRSSKENKTF